MSDIFPSGLAEEHAEHLYVLAGYLDNWNSQSRGTLFHRFAARYYILASVGQSHRVQPHEDHSISPILLVVLYYDWLLTVPSEIERFWKLKLTGPGCLFMLNRYFPIICVIFEMIGFFTDTFSHEVCPLWSPRNTHPPLLTRIARFTGVRKV